MPLLYFFLTRKNPMKVIRGMVPALVTTFGKSSGGAALPVSMHCMEDNLKVDRRITRFLLPLGFNINMVYILLAALVPQAPCIGQAG
ncbi:sodium:dicarboxylate symporter family domain-containing protein [Ditylenchus destructor]|nr:sodium:dicarboxylate symporter family domain-containing protein [Ditylenchus destructor]